MWTTEDVKKQDKVVKSDCRHGKNIRAGIRLI